MRSIKRGLAFLAIATICIWPAILNRQPLFFADTTAYVRGAAVGFAWFLNQETVWSPSPNANVEDAQQRSSPGIPPGKTVLAGRSIYYGTFLYLSQLADGGFWPAVLLQAGVVVLAIAMTLQSFGLYTLRSLAVISVCLAALTPMAFFVSYLMPDIFASVAILAWANLALAGSRMSNRALASLSCLLAMALLFHTSHSLITIVLLFATLIYCWIARLPIPWRAVAALGVALALAVGGEAVFNAVTTQTAGTAPLRPPFLSARLIADGPGYRYLEHACPAAGFELCHYTGRIAALQHAVVTRPMSDEILWNADPKIGVFSAVDSEARRKLAEEQFKFVERTTMFDPAGVLRSVFNNSGEQLRSFTLDEFDLDSGGKGFFLSHMPEPFLGTLETSRVWFDSMPIKEMSTLSLFTVIAGIVLSAACLLIWKPLSLPANGAQLFSFIIGAGVFINAVICGSLSTPHDRYEARVIWLVPFLAILLLRAVAKTFRLRAGFAVVPSQMNKPQPDPLAV